MHIVLKIIEGIPILGGIAIAVVGLIVPHWVLFWAKRQSRLWAVAFGVCITFIGGSLVSLIDKHEFGPLAGFSVLLAFLVAGLMTPKQPV